VKKLCIIHSATQVQFNSMASKDIVGKWQMTSSENFDEFMAALGVSYLTRKLGNASKPLVTIEQLGPQAYSMKQESLVKVRCTSTTAMLTLFS